MKGNTQMQNSVEEAVEQVDGKLEAVDDQIMGEVEIGNGVKVVDAVVVFLFLFFSKAELQSY